MGASYLSPVTVDLLRKGYVYDPLLLSWVPGQQALLKTDTLTVGVTGTVNVAGGVTATPPADLVTTGSVGQLQSLTRVLGHGEGAVAINVSGTWSGTLFFEASIDGTNWFATKVIGTTTNQSDEFLVSQTTLNGHWVTSVGGYSKFRVSGDIGNTGSATVTITAVTGAQHLVKVSNPITISGAVTAEGVGGLLTASGTVSSSGDNLLITPDVNFKIRLYYMSYNPASTVTVAFKFHTLGDPFLRNTVPAGSIVAKDSGDFRYVDGDVGFSLYLNLSAAVTTNWNIFYQQVL